MHESWMSYDIWLIRNLDVVMDESFWVYVFVKEIIDCKNKISFNFFESFLFWKTSHFYMIYGYESEKVSLVSAIGSVGLLMTTNCFTHSI